MLFGPCCGGLVYCVSFLFDWLVLCLILVMFLMVVFAICVLLLCLSICFSLFWLCLYFIVNFVGLWFCCVVWLVCLPLILGVVLCFRLLNLRFVGLLAVFCG